MQKPQIGPTPPSPPRAATAKPPSTSSWKVSCSSCGSSCLPALPPPRRPWPRPLVCLPPRRRCCRDEPQFATGGSRSGDGAEEEGSNHLVLVLLRRSSFRVHTICSFISNFLEVPWSPFSS